MNEPNPKFMSEYLADKPRIKLLKYGTAQLVDLEKTYQCPGLIRRILDFPVTDQKSRIDHGAV